MKNKHFYFIGIGGIGMSALVRILLQKGCKVSGSDVALGSLTQDLKNKGAEIFEGHSADRLNCSMTVIYNTNISEQNPEYLRARELKLPLLHRSDLLKDLMEGYYSLLVAGCHGKTTTSSLFAHVLIEVGLDPSYAIGGIVRSLNANGGHGEGPYFVAEADESDGSFLKYPAFGAILTNIDNDHLNYWKTQEALILGFKEFSSRIFSENHLFWCKDDEYLNRFGLKGVSYGFDEKADLFVKNFRQIGWRMVFDFHFESQDFLDVDIPLIGAYNVLNAAAVFGLCLRLNLSECLIRRALRSFQGVGRRVEKKGEINDIEVFDDYAHHPTEIFATLRAMKAAVGDKRLVVVFQPHRYSRVRDCFAQFPDAFDLADELILTDIYPGGEKPIEGVTTHALCEAIRSKSERRIHHVSREEVVSYLISFLRPRDVLLTMGAGDITKIGPDVLEHLSL
ncbi:MAG: UDP-N-acetylmuramate--L-alanine ligase [Anaerolineae bacterium]